MDIKKLEDLAESNKAANDILFCFTQLNRSKQVINLINFKRFLKREGFELSMHDFMEVFLTFEKEGLGSFIYNKLNQPSAFRWKHKVKARELGYIARRESYKPGTERRNRPTGIKRRAVYKRPQVISKRPERMILAIPLSTGEVLKIEVQNSISNRDIQTITKIISTI